MEVKKLIIKFLIVLGIYHMKFIWINHYFLCIKNFQLKLKRNVQFIFVILSTIIISLIYICEKIYYFQKNFQNIFNSIINHFQTIKSKYHILIKSPWRKSFLYNTLIFSFFIVNIYINTNIFFDISSIFYLIFEKIIFNLFYLYFIKFNQKLLWI